MHACLNLPHYSLGKPLPPERMEGCLAKGRHEMPFKPGDVEGIRWLARRREGGYQPTDMGRRLNPCCTTWPSLIITSIQHYKDEVLEILFDSGSGSGHKKTSMVNDTPLNISIDGQTLGFTKKVLERFGANHPAVQDSLYCMPSPRAKG